MTTRYITSVQHPLVKHLVKLRENRSYRYDNKSVLIEGMTLITEMRGEGHFKIIATKNEMLIPLGLEADEILIVSDSVLQKISGVQTPEGLIAEIEMPKPKSLQNKRWIIAFDEISDPGNLGTLLRSALAFGWEGAFLLNNCCDPFNDKALRAAKGATFRLPIQSGTWNELKQLVSENHLTPFVADTTGNELAKAPKTDRILLVLGNEARGPSSETKQYCQPLTINMAGNMESLNVAVAGSIIMYHLKQL